MVNFYHGSGGFFTKPDFSMVKDGMSLGLNEYGWGFYAATYGGDAWEYIEGLVATDKQAFIYSMSVDEDEFEQDFLVSHKEISTDKLDRIIGALEKAKEFDAAQKWMDRRGEAIPTRDVYYDVIGAMRAKDYAKGPKQAAEIFANAGFVGYLEGCYAVFLAPDRVPEFEMDHAYNYKRDAAADFALLKRIDNGDRLSDYASEKFQGRVQTLEIRSEMAREGLRTLMQENAPLSTIELYLDVIELSEQSDNNGGFALRDSLGHAVCRSFLVHPRQKDDAYFGTNATNLVETFERYYRADMYSINGFEEKLRDFADALADHPKVAYVIQNAPTQKDKGYSR